MIGPLAKIALDLGVPAKLAKAAAWAAIVFAAIALILVVLWAVREAGGDAVRVEQAAEQIKHVGEARQDERSAVVVTKAIADRVARADRKTDEQLKITIEDLRHAIDEVPPAAAGDAVPAAPVDRLREELNASIARANRSADPPAAE